MPALHGAGRWAQVVIRATAAAAFLPCVALRGQGTGADSTRRDSVRHVLPPVTVRSVRELSVAPPVATLRIDPVALRTTPAGDAWDLVRRVTGIEVHEQGQGPGYASNAVIRGFTSDHSADVLLLVDGVPVNLPINGHGEGYADWNVLLAPAVSAMRVVTGTASPLHGDFALGGTVEVFTAADAAGTSAGLSGWSRAGGGGWLVTGARAGLGGHLEAIDLQQDAGWRPHSASTRANGLLRGWRKVGRGRLEAGLHLYRSTWDSPGFVAVDRYNADDLAAATDPSDGGMSSRVIATARYAGPLAGTASVDASSWAQAGRLHFFLNIPEGTDAPQQTEELDRRGAVGGHVQLTWPRPSGELTIGATARADAANYDRYETSARARDALDVSYDASYLAGGAYVRWRKLYRSLFGLDLGARTDMVSYRTTAPGEATLTATRGIFSPKLGARWILPSGDALFGSLSRGFRGAVGVIAEPTRAPYLAWSSELGLERQRGSWRARLALFRLDVSNERIQDPVTLGISSAGSSVRQGVDGELEWHPSPRTRLEAAGTWNDAALTGHYADAHGDNGQLATALVPGIIGDPLRHDVPGDENSPGQRVPGVAHFTARVSAAGPVGATAAWHATVRVIGPYVPIGEPTVQTQTYSVLDVGLRMPAGATGWTVEAELQNALDVHYVENRASGFVTPGVPRMLRLGMQHAP